MLFGCLAHIVWMKNRRKWSCTLALLWFSSSFYVHTSTASPQQSTMDWWTTEENIIVPLTYLRENINALFIFAPRKRALNIACLWVQNRPNASKGSQMSMSFCFYRKHASSKKRETFNKWHTYWLEIFSAVLGFLRLYYVLLSVCEHGYQRLNEYDRYYR